MADGSSELYKIADSPGKGKGVFATQAIEEGTRIWEESSILTTEVGTQLDIYLQYDLLDRSQPELARQFLSLSSVGHMPPVPGCHLSAQQVVQNAPPGGMVRGLVLAYEACAQSTEVNASGVRVQKSQYAGMVMDRNVLASVLAIFDNNFCRTSRDGETKSIFYNYSRLNHSCMPNCHAAWNPDTKMLTVHAVNDIRAGEELCITYHAENLDSMHREERKKYLRERYGFECSCLGCDPFSKSSSLLDKIADLTNKIKPYVRTDKRLTTPALVNEYAQVLNLMKEADLDNWMNGRM
jgi:hypothetical protein